MARPSAGLSGAALFVGLGGLYLAYAGVRDVSLTEGLRSLLRGERPVEKQSSFQPITLADAAASEGDAPPADGAKGDTGIRQLRGTARLAYPLLKAAFPDLRMGGWRATGSVPDSDHPKGLAIDVMTSDPATANRVIALARTIPNLSYWIWNRHIASAAHGWVVRPYSGPSPHTDHVHLSWSH